MFFKRRLQRDLSQETFRLPNKLSVFLCVGKVKSKYSVKTFERFLIVTDSPPFALPVFQNIKTGGLHQGPQITHNKVIIMQEMEQLLTARCSFPRSPSRRGEVCDELTLPSQGLHPGFTNPHPTGTCSSGTISEKPATIKCAVVGRHLGFFFLMRDKLQTHETFMVSWLTKQKNEGVFCQGNQ